MSTLDFDSLQAEMQSQFDNGDLMRQSVEYGCAYLAAAQQRQVAPSPAAVATLSDLRQPLPASLGDAAAILEQLHEYGSPATMSQVGGRFFGLVNGSALPVALAARLLADSWDQNAVLHAVSPTNAVIEDICQSWLVELLGLPSETVAGFVSGTSMAIVCGLAAARWRLCRRQGWDINAGGLAGAPPIRIVTGRHAHSTVLKAIALLGFGTDSIEWVEVDAQGGLLADALPSLDDRTIVILQAGNVNSGAFDPIRAVCSRANQAGAWVHVDGAFGLWAASCETLHHLTDGLELAQSWSVDAHKTLNIPYDNGLSLCADPEALVKALQNSGDYIMYSSERDSLLFTPEMSRRARAIELWAGLAYLGRQGVDALILSLHQRALQFRDELDAVGIPVLNKVVFNQVLIQVGNDDQTRAFVARVQQSGEAWVGASSWFDQPVVRISVCSWATTSEDVTRAVAALSAAFASVH